MIGDDKQLGLTVFTVKKGSPTFKVLKNFGFMSWKDAYMLAFKLT